MAKELISFDVKTGMKNIIGRDLITDDFIAIYELVKNSYDAYADHVTLTFNDNEIIISDNGKGMSKEDLKEKWFAVAYSAKKDGTEDRETKRLSHFNNLKSRRYYAGAKGVGRFSCDRLGNRLELTTTSPILNQTFRLSIDWEQFEIDSKQSFVDIKIPIEEIESNILYDKGKQFGTILRISILNSNWSENKLFQLKRSLEKLINPFSGKNEFEIEIVAKKYIESDKERSKYQKINGTITNSILKVLDIKTTQINVSIGAEIIVTKLFDRGILIYHIEEPNLYTNTIINLEINLYFLNRSAKVNFGKIMDIEPVNYGNVFLFKNGFRVQPYGDVGDDSWEIDRRKQQGYNRFLGTRDLFGKVDLITEDFNEFKEVSSRDGGLVETSGKRILFDFFYDKALKRLERYVAGVLWGEAFIRKNYFINADEANKQRENLSNDKDKDSYEDVKKNLGSKIDFVNLIRALSDDDNIKIVDYNKELVDFVNDNLDLAQPKFISELERIAEKTNDGYLINQVKLTSENFNRILKEKEEAEIRANEEERKRKDAEEKARKEEEARRIAEQKQKEAEEKRRQAELEVLRKEKERAEAELARIKAEQKAKQEKEKREQEEQERKKAEKEATLHKQQVARYKAAESVDYKDLRDSNHIIGVYSDDISKKILLLKRRIDKGRELSRSDLINFIQGISLANEKISTITRFTTKSNYLKATLETTEDIVSYVVDYIQKIYKVLYSIEIQILTQNVSFIKKFQPIELITAIDNILSNSRKKSASEVIFDFSLKDGDLQLSIKDVGEPLSQSITDWNLIFEEGITTTKGSGLGLSHVKRIVEENLKGQIIYNPNYTAGFELIITIPK
jgi:signal transduction histidine kinase